MLTPLLIAAAFLAGLLAGAFLREAFDLATTGKGHLMDLVTRLARRVTGSRTVGIVLVTLSLVVNAFLGFSFIATQDSVTRQGEQVAAQGKRLEVVVDCQARFNAEKAEALKARDVVLQATTDEELDLWRKLRTVLSTPTATSAQLLAAIDAYIVRIETVQATRRANPYPDPAFCVEETD